jgi:hypothetical protein
VRVRATDRRRGVVVFDRSLKAKDGVLSLERLPTGRLHLDFQFPSGLTSCYDADVTSLWTRLIADVIYEPVFDPGGPVEGPFPWFAQRFDQLRHTLPQLGIATLHALAHADIEEAVSQLMTMSADARGRVSGMLLRQAFRTARQLLGLDGVTGITDQRVILHPGQPISRALLPGIPGKVAFSFNGPSDAVIEMQVEGPHGIQNFALRSGQPVDVPFVAADVAAKVPMQMQWWSAGPSPLTGHLVTEVSGSAEAAKLAKQWLTGWLTEIYAGLNAQNPGLGGVPTACLDTQRIRTALDGAKAILQQAGVCNVEALGPVHMVPMPILRPGLYLGPEKANPGAIPVLAQYAFAEVLTQGVLRYVPNDVLHTWAIVVGGSWDIKDQQVIIGHEVRELMVIARSIAFSSSTRISW